MKKLITICAVAGMILTVSGVASAVIVGPGGPNYDSINGLLSDFQQSYGQVVGDDITLNNSGQKITSLTVYGLYYNYSDMTFNAPLADNFTIRLHDIDGTGDPAESFFYEENIGAGTRTDTGEDYAGLTIFEYIFTGLNINIPTGSTLISVIDDTVDPSVNGYWHWVSADDDSIAWWRREDSQPVGQESTFYWTDNSTSFPGNRAFSVEVIPEPTSIALLGLGGLLLRRKKNA